MDTLGITNQYRHDISKIKGDMRYIDNFNGTNSSVLSYRNG